MVPGPPMERSPCVEVRMPNRKSVSPFHAGKPDDNVSFDSVPCVSKIFQEPTAPTSLRRHDSFSVQRLLILFSWRHQKMWTRDSSILPQGSPRSPQWRQFRVVQFWTPKVAFRFFRSNWIEMLSCDRKNWNIFGAPALEQTFDSRAFLLRFHAHSTGGPGRQTVFLMRTRRK